jgi:hypothetical protein
VSLAPRDVEALELFRSRTFGTSALASFEIELQARRLCVRFYGALRSGDRATYLGAATFFGAGELNVANADAAFPDSARVSSVEVTYDDELDRGTARVNGARAWTLSWTFDGLAYEEHAAVLASLADES